MKAAIYMRVSTEDQAERYGLDSQREKCLMMLKLKDWELHHIYSDDGISGTKDVDERPQLAALLEDGEAGKFQAIVAYSIDRIGRKTKLILELAERIEQANLELVTVRENIDTSSAAGRMFFQLMAVLAEFERNTIVERTTNGRNARGRIDGEKGGRVPIGYTRTENGIAIDPIGVAIVKRIYNRKRQGHSLRKIARDLNTDGIPTPRSGHWSHAAIRAVLDNRDKYLGGRRGESPLRWPAVFSAEFLTQPS